MLGDRGHQRRRGGVRILPAQQINSAAAADQISQIRGGAAATGDAASANVVLEEQAHRLLHRGDRVAGRPIIALQRTLQQPVPIRGGMRMLTENLGRLARDRGFATQRSTWSKVRPVKAAAWKNAWITFAASAA